MTMAAITPPLILDFFLDLPVVLFKLLTSTEVQFMFCPSSPEQKSWPTAMVATNSSANALINKDWKNVAYDDCLTRDMGELIFLVEIISKSSHPFTRSLFFRLPYASCAVKRICKSI